MSTPTINAGGAYLPLFTPDLYRVSERLALRVFREPLTRRNTPPGVWPTVFDPVASLDRGELIDQPYKDRTLEKFDACCFQSVLLDIVRAAHPRVRWALHRVPDFAGQGEGCESLIFGVAEGHVVAMFAPVRPLAGEG